jgi:hypothetical protein
MNPSISWLPWNEITKKQFGKEGVPKFILAHTTALKMEGDWNHEKANGNMLRVGDFNLWHRFGTGHHEKRHNES